MLLPATYINIILLRVMQNAFLYVMYLYNITVTLLLLCYTLLTYIHNKLVYYIKIIQYIIIIIIVGNTNDDANKK